MRLKTTHREWEIIRDSNIWRLPQNENDIMPALRLSYYHLPFYLKRCFAYFAAYQVNNHYKKKEVIQSWIAHGFVHLSSEEYHLLEDLGNEYVQELFRRSLIQDLRQDNCGNLISFKIHDLVHNLSKDVGGTEFLHFVKGNQVHNPREVRYAELYHCPDSDIVKVLGKILNLGGLRIRKFPVENIVSSLKCLRCLYADSCPGFIGELKHLRKLYLSDIQTLPESVSKLVNLQIFEISRCSELRGFPKDIGKMVNLKHIYVSESAPLSYMPLGFKYLSSLRTLTMFFVGKGVGCKLNELCGLKHLEGDLAIKNLENVCDARDCAEVNLKGKKGLESLKFSWNDRNCDEDVSKERSVDVQEILQPHSNLKILLIEGYMGYRFAIWMMKPNIIPKLLVVCLMNCRNVKELPPFGELPLLMVLVLKDMNSVESINGRGENESKEWFPSLQELRLENLINLRSFGLKEDSGVVSSLPSLVELRIIRCPQLGNLPKLPSLKRVKVNYCGEKLVQSLLMLPDENPSSSSLTRLKSLKIKGCDDLISLPENWSWVLVSLVQLVVEDCSSLVSLEDGSDAPESTCLLKLKISKVPNLVHLPQWIRNLSKLQFLEIILCKGLIEVPVWLWEPITSLVDLRIYGCEKLKSLPDGMQSLTALEDLVIGGCNSWMSWPNGLESQN